MIYIKKSDIFSEVYVALSGYKINNFAMIKQLMSLDQLKKASKSYGFSFATILGHEEHKE